MGRYILSRLLQSIPVLILVSVISFGLMKLVPGDPAILIGGPTATPAELDNIRQNLGLDQPFHVQMWRYYAGLVRGDLGTSLLLGKPVLEATLERIPVSLSIAVYSMVLTLLIGLSCGILAALNRGTWIDQAAMVFALIGVSLPNFWLGLMLIVLLSVHLGWLPTGGYVPWQTDVVGWFKTTTMPAVSLALLQVGLLARITRSTMLEVLRQDYIRTARAKGLPEFIVIAKHAFRNVMIPVVTVIGVIFSVLISGSVVVESVFSVPGIGSLLGSAVLRRDYPMIQGGLLLVAASLLMLNLIVDVLYAYFDPRVRYDNRG
ncbi:MAG: ABC transporter permease [Hyphomicrobiaceae bacterium]